MNKGFYFPGIILTTSLLLFTIPSVSQERISVYGIVTDAVTKLPIRNVNVFFNNTSLAALTDSMGVYRIENVPMGLREIVASSVGYVTQIHNLNSPDKRPIVFFKMYPDNPPGFVNASGTGIRRMPVLDEKKWNDLYVRFKQVVLGDGISANHTEILNATAIHFDLSDAETDLFFAHADSPLEIINHSLGYKLLISLVEFQASLTTYSMLFRTQFDTLRARKAIEKMRWRINRLSIYQGSPRHLFKSAREGRLREAGFRVYEGLVTLDVRPNNVAVRSTGINWAGQYNYLMNDKSPAAEDIYVDTTKSKFKVFRKGFYQINYVHSCIQKKDRLFKDYPFPVSWLNVIDSCINLNAHGELVLPAEFTFYGHMNRYRVPEMLPYDYNPDQEKSDLESSGQIKSVSLRGTIKDEQNMPLPEVEVFINGGLNHTTTDSLGQFELRNLRPGIYPVVFAHPEMEKTMSRINVSGDNDDKISVQLRDRRPIAYNIDDFNQRRDPQWQMLMHLFESKLCKQGSYNPTIVNPYMLILNASEKRIDVQAMAPLVVEDRTLGYRWIYFMDSASLIKEGGSYKLHASGLVKMDTLSSKSARENYRWQANRFTEYIGSWNHFAHALVAGNAEGEGFEIYRLIKPMVKPTAWKKLTKYDCVPIQPDSLLIMEKGRFFLQVPNGFEIHFEDKRDSKKMYSDYAYRVMRITNGSQVPITVDGIVAPGSFEISETQTEFIPRMPVDYYPASLRTAVHWAEPIIKK